MFGLVAAVIALRVLIIAADVIGNVLVAGMTVFGDRLILVSHEVLDVGLMGIADGECFLALGALSALPHRQVREWAGQQANAGNGEPEAVGSGVVSFAPNEVRNDAEEDAEKPAQTQNGEEILDAHDDPLVVMMIF